MSTGAKCIALDAISTYS